MIKYIIFLTFLECAEQVPQKPIKPSKNDFMENSSKSSNALYKRELGFLKDYIQRGNIPFKQSKEFGFWYNIEGHHKDKIKTEDIVYISYKIKRVNNTQELLYEGTMDFKVDKSNIIRGLNEGIKLMSYGQKGIFIFPSYLAYGLVGDGNKIKTDTPLIYEIEVKEKK